MFDLPVKTKAERKRANGFRKYLLKCGFQMLQLSIYIKHCRDQAQVERLAVQVASEIPHNGKVDMVIITDKQYESIVTYYGAKKLIREIPSHLTLF